MSSSLIFLKVKKKTKHLSDRETGQEGRQEVDRSKYIRVGRDRLIGHTRRQTVSKVIEKLSNCHCCSVSLFKCVFYLMWVNSEVRNFQKLV